MHPLLWWNIAPIAPSLVTGCEYRPKERFLSPATPSICKPGPQTVPTTSHDKVSVACCNVRFG